MTLYPQDARNSCGAVKVNTQGPLRRGCGNPPTRSVADVIFVCEKHYRMAVEEFTRELVDQNLEVIKMQRERISDLEQGLEPLPAWSPPEKAEQVVYFMRCQGFVKIGISSDPERRLVNIRRGGGSAFPRLMDIAATELVATELGGRARESELHVRFASFRHTGEWFTESPEITEYINLRSSS